MSDRLAQLRAEFQQELQAVTAEASAAALRDRWVGRKAGRITAEMKTLGKLAPEERKTFGAQLNELKDAVEADIEKLLAQFAAQREAEQLIKERIDVTLPGRRIAAGHLHPITLLRQRIEDIFVSMGYEIEDGPEIETAFYNFEALNIPANHPARSPQDTFYLAGEHGERLSLRSQTSTMQIHAMQKRQAKGPPLRIAAPGRVFRRDTPDATHNPMFYQVEGLLVDRGITLGDLKGTVEEFVRRLFGPDTKTRFRPSYFPFVEPGAEIDYTCFKCHGSGCRVCKQSGWIEMGGSGMVHPNVLRGVGIDPQEFSGFAFGLGLDRLCALMYGLDDIRLLYENDVRFLEQFS
ncbi:MAG: phenylalanine--tRNA ligase subunit alpha [Acidobacteria bacterium]|nr:phenylalanine--tRNA ligase subunit alpha [Acidobacteriota bacterium]MBI3421455.1 phenylalanine--tRNA ligase subunit alpha [Acidobacteriota bacterium]